MFFPKTRPGLLGKIDWLWKGFPLPEETKASDHVGPNHIVPEPPTTLEYAKTLIWLREPGGTPTSSDHMFYGKVARYPTGWDYDDMNVDEVITAFLAKKDCAVRFNGSYYPMSAVLKVEILERGTVKFASKLDAIYYRNPYDYTPTPK